ncbi:hypothetical protein [Acidovorax cavernicola]|uniref:Uncharacterized protein n=1 Tax=Acidovorax cavernicola TaxID=1675792 RepID=A0A9X8D4D4_9BURK|nr:hypothetical protein [Acidovorax cavernicola]RIX78343.1 hypothetical protein D3H34_16710 [Acidovorax cavernicola]
MMGASDAHKERPSLLGSSAPTTDPSNAAASGESTRVLAQFGGREGDARAFFARPGVWASLAVLIGVAGATTYHLQSKRADASATVAAATPAPVAAPAAVQLPKPEVPAAAATAAPEPTPARIVEGDSTPPPQPQQQQPQQPASTPFAAIGAQPMAVPPTAKSAKATRPDSKGTAVARKQKPERIASGSKKPVQATANGKPVKTAANTSKAAKSTTRANITQTAARPSGPDPDTDLLTALLKRSKTSDPASPPPIQADATTADCKTGQRCKP